MFYAIRHITKFKYSTPINENVMDVRMQPRTDEAQQCINFHLHVRPTARMSSYQDYLNNTIHHFDIPGLHSELSITAESVVNVMAPPALPAALTLADWELVDQLSSQFEHWEMVSASAYTQCSPILEALADELQVNRYTDPLTILRELNTAIQRTFTYSTDATSVDSPIEEAIAQRRGVCQDYAHVMLALVRNFLHMPCRYVSGYLYHRQSDQSTSDATHAWIEVLLPQLGWVGFDPTNNLIVGERHIRAAIGRDYHDVPPTRGIFKGNTDSQLGVSVHVRKTDEPNPGEAAVPDVHPATIVPAIISYAPAPNYEQQQQQVRQQQQQQQQ